MKDGVSVLVTDLDNTLFDWVDIWHRSFSALLAELHRASGVPHERLLDEIRAIHRRYGTSEYAFLAEELGCVRESMPREQWEAAVRAANQAGRDARHAATRLYPGVQRTLKQLRDRGVLIIGYTESSSFYTGRRVRRLGLDGLLQILYSPPDHELPAGFTPEQVRGHACDYYEFKHTRHYHTPAGELKPNPDLLRAILDGVGASPAQAVYVGDSPMKDIAMAQDAGVTDVLALYGRAQDRDAYELLRRVTHWTEEDVARERRILERGDIRPSYVLKRSFAELPGLFPFVAFTGRDPAATAAA
ncbi:MAG TPA: HAD family hydrolase [Longimicrobium sp.]|nr:HAD family hydrolase [Longimicrobium sp.]